MRTIQVVNVRWFNATAWYGLTLAKLLRDAGHPTLVLTLPGTAPETKAREWGLDHLSLDLNTTRPWEIPRLYGRLRRVVRDFKPQVVNCHRGESFIIWGLLKAAMANGPHAFRLVRTRGDQRPPKANLPNRVLHARVADHVIATCDTIAHDLRDRLGVPERKLSVIRGGVDRDAFAFDPAGRERVRAEFGFAESDIVAGVVGRFDEVKGQREVIEAVAKARSMSGGGRIKLLLVGFASPIPETEVQGWIDAHGLRGHAAITGRRPDVAACLSALDVGVVASKWSETIARAALELLACGRPVVGTRVGVLPDILPGETVLTPGNVDELTEFLNRIASNPTRLAEIVRAQRPAMAGLGLPSFCRSTVTAYNV